MNAGPLEITCLVWNGQLWTTGGWRAYRTRHYDVTSPTGGHYDHIPRLGRPMTAQPPEIWMADAAFRDRPADWFTEPSGAAEIRATVATCTNCPVRQPCLHAALALAFDEDLGIWGGTTVEQRQRLRTGRQERRRPPHRRPTRAVADRHPRHIRRPGSPSLATPTATSPTSEKVTIISPQGPRLRAHHRRPRRRPSAPVSPTPRRSPGGASADAHGQ